MVTHGFLYRVLRSCYFFLFSKIYRHDFFTKILYKKHVFQPNSYTQPNRYPDLFQICQEYFLKKRIIKSVILSFGCSTGEECFSLRKYLPYAKIIGVDINNNNLKICQRKNQDQNIKFTHVLSTDFASLAYLDAVFCLAVLQHTQNRAPNNQIARKFTFEQFSKILEELDLKLKVNGLLFIYHCDFSFADTRIARKYQPLAVKGNQIINKRPLYNNENVRISDHQPLVYRVFVKIANS